MYKITILIYESTDRREYGKGITIEQEVIDDLPDLDKCGINLISRSLYSLLKALGRSMRKEFGIPLFVDTHNTMDGSILSCSFSIDKERHKELKTLGALAEIHKPKQQRNTL